MENTNTFKARQNAFGMAYATSKERKALSVDKRHDIMDNYVDYSLNNKADHGGKGKAFEVEMRRALNPNTTVLKCQRQALNDITLKNGKSLNIECKTGGGAVIEGIWFNGEWKEQINLKKHLQFDYIAYIFKYTGTKSSELYRDTVIMTKAAFIEWCENWKGGATSWLTYKSKEGRVMIANPKSTTARKEHATKNLIAWAKEHKECYTLTEFQELLNR